ncbi:MAG: TonB-dependent receptor [Bacteroidota bacterium]
MKRYLILLSFLLLVSTLTAQQNWSGQVKGTDGQALEYANVLLYKMPDSSFVRGAVTGKEGYYFFEQLASGAYFLNASLLGYGDYYSPAVELDASGDIQHDVVLREDGLMLEAVDVVAEKPLFEQKIDRTVVNVQNSITSAGATALEVLERSPGVTVDRINGQLGLQGKEGVIVMLNGKRMRMEGQALVQLLQSMPAGQVEKIELITAPPASFDAEGDAGIINIQTLKNEGEGMNANIALNTAYGQRAKYGGSVNFNFRKNKLNLFADLSMNHDYSLHDVDISRINEFEGRITTIGIRTQRPAFTGLYNARLGLDYDLSKKTTVGLLMTGYRRHWDMTSTTDNTVVDNIDGDLSSQLVAAEINDWSHWMVNASVRHRFDEHSELAFDVDYLEYLDDNPVSYLDRQRDSEQQLREEEFRSLKYTPLEFKVARLDYKRRWRPGFSSEMGIKGTLSGFTNDVSVDRLDKQTWVNDPHFTDIYRLDEKIAAAYASFDITLSPRLKAKAGLRYEYYDSDLGSDQEGRLLLQQFGRLFPTAFLTWELNDQQQIQLSYNERITRPAFNDIAPAFFFWGFNTILGGNPTVKPTISRKVSAALRHKSLLLTLQYSDDDNPLVFQPEVDAEANVLMTRVVNMADRKGAMISLNAPWQLTSWWESRYNLAAYWQHFEPIVEGEVLTRNDRYVTATVSQNFKLPQDFGAELTANWSSRRSWGLAQVPARASFNLGLQKSFSPDVKLSLSWNDLFNLGSFFDINFDEPDLNIVYRMRYEFEGNIARLALTWQLGNGKIKRGAERQTGSEEERRRMN